MGKGYGKQLMKAVIAELKSLGYKDVFLWVLEQNIGAKKFYESIGFTFSGDTIKTEIGGKTVKESRYCLRQL